jgi:hypothetical protein
MLLLCWLLHFELFPDITELIFLSLVTVLWFTFVYDAVFRNAPEEVFE